MNSNPNCVRCSSLCASRTRIVLPCPCPPGGLLAIGEAPGADEDFRGVGFVGKAGQRLDQLLAVHSIGRRDYGRANIVRCRPDGNRKPTPGERAACLPLLAETIINLRPKVLLLVGGTAVEAFLGGGSLSIRIEQSQRSTFCDFSLAHDALRAAIAPLVARQGGVIAVPMPHTSPLAWHRNAPDGRKWSEIGAEQVALAVSRLRD